MDDWRPSIKGLSFEVFGNDSSKRLKEKFLEEFFVALFSLSGTSLLGLKCKISYVVGNGRRIRFWRDIWCGDTPLRTSFPSLFAIATSKDA
ncbi:hypothetical protein CK203_039843 [Vitis vinifera]|uniref:Uncharacterized protein n=1 Tax=Vitis vinifera TaxID=29760 RepID=A0A438HQG8_VITVI|nr:hypothetical protein CK203_039843 [Vitis vinifera]